MARRVLYETNYTFTPSTKTIVIQRYIPRERLILITNVTTGVPIFNFSDSRLTATSYTATSAVGTSGNQGTTTIVLAYNTVNMSSAHKLQIMIDEATEFIAPSETLMDPVGKLRVSEPQSLIDTDFEYGLQPTKWENVQLINNRASYSTPINSPRADITSISITSGSRLAVALTSTPPANGTVIQVTGTTYAPAEGFVTTDFANSTSFQYVMKQTANTTANIFLTSSTQVFNAARYTGGTIPLTTITNSGVVVTCNTAGPHGLVIGNYVIAKDYTATTNPPNGIWVVRTVPTANQFIFDVTSAPTGTIAAGTISARPEGQILHRPFDGGVQYSTGTTFHGYQVARQTRRFFRYQSGKGIQMSTNVIFKPGFNVDQISNVAAVVTVRTKIAHNLAVGVSITVSGCTPTAYNGTFTISAVIDPYTFTYTAGSTPGALTAGIPYVVVNSWSNAGIRCGMFDSQNGFYYEFDGSTLYTVRRSATTQLSGTVSVTNGSQTITGTNSYFPLQINSGDFVVIRGQTYRVATITSNTAMTVIPEYRGSTISSVSISKVIETKVAQTSWNIDTMNGSGPSGYSLDLTKTQMLYMDYSWYGAGSIRFGFKDIKGEVVYCHRFVHNNSQTEAYIRSGNLPGRYETNTLGAYTYLTATANATVTSLTVADTTLFPTAGAILIADPASYEYCNYTGKTATTFTGLTRGITGSSPASVVTTAGSATITGASLTTAAVQPGMFISGTGILEGTYIISVATGVSAVMSQAATASGTITATVYTMGSANATHTFSATAPIAIYGHSPSFSPLISHWGTSVIMDGKFDDDRSFVFNTGMLTALSVGQSNTNALVSLRIAPSVDNGLTGTLGIKEIINRMQLTLRGVEVRSDGNMLVQLILNGTTSGSATFSQPTGNPSSLAQIATHAAATTISGGEVIYSFYTQSGGAGTYGSTSFDINLIRDLGNSILGGGTNNSANSSGQFYPDGPDVLSVVVTNLEGAARNATARISWTEAQA